ncbi:glycoside hydrolase [Asticcacaulis sp. ZE23SCel15]|uniref:glycoside hydrolase n=1 Tax=Asticcacaulis sp. ZE23SCel15 TaxID=3059027 RepID=UPI00265D987D|nr:glycoside hydrolase [Asticcacaulis sp. ZE23SCel15]WKL57476.1 glycoside hydrolase [Asticcacaulis sp. ZE23SCel15]
MKAAGLLTLALVAGACAPLPYAKAEMGNYSQRIITAPPPALGLDPFYTKYADASGIPVTTSSKVPDDALLAARDIVIYLLSERPDLRDALIREGARVGVMAVDETTTDLPEQSHWKKPAKDDPRLSKCDVRDYDTTIGKMSDRDYWAMRARGMGGLYTTGAAENILGVPGTRYYGENILVHEFSHNILNAIRTTDPALMTRIEAAFANAKAKGLWRGAYMALNIDEYWAEGTQFWFNSNKAYKTDDVMIATSDDLKTHDPELYKVLSEVYRRDHRIPTDAFYMHPARLNVAKADLVNDCYS